MSKESDQLARRLLASPAGSEIRQALERQQNATATLSENEYLVPVSYAPLPSFAELETEFGKGNVSTLFDGSYEFKKHASCMNIDETPGNRIFLVKHFNRNIGSEEAIAQMDELGYRPATHLEAYAFQKVNPELQRHFRIVALGSSTMDDGHRVAVLHRHFGWRIFAHGWFSNEWWTGLCFLFVRK